MHDPIQHLPGIETDRVRTARLSTQILTSGPRDGQPVILLHGNLSAATFWEETMLVLSDRCRIVAPDQRGFGESDPSALIDATRGFADWAEDAIALADHLGWPRFHLVGHSLGGCVGWWLLGHYPERLKSVTLVSPGPPGGFPGAHGDRGQLNHEDAAGSGAGLVNPRMVDQLRQGDRGNSDELFSPRAVMNRVYWKPPFRPSREEALLTAMLKVHMGERQFPGDMLVSNNWPGFAPGRYGPINAFSPRNNQGLLKKVLAVSDRPRLLWIQGSDDPIVSDNSMSDPGQQGLMGLRPDWPGAQTFPPQPLLSQVQFALDAYEDAGGIVTRRVFPDVGHTPYLERPLEFQAALREHLRMNC